MSLPTTSEIRRLNSPREIMNLLDALNKHWPTSGEIDDVRQLKAVGAERLRELQGTSGTSAGQSLEDRVSSARQALGLKRDDRELRARVESAKAALYGPRASRRKRG